MARTLTRAVVLAFLVLVLRAHAACTPSRPMPAQRRFVSDAVEEVISNIAPRMRDKELACIFANALPNTLDTTVFAHAPIDGENDTFILTGDIEAMWLRDSMNQVRTTEYFSLSPSLPLSPLFLSFLLNSF